MICMSFSSPASDGGVVNPDDVTLSYTVLLYCVGAICLMVIYALLARFRYLQWLLDPRGGLRFSDFVSLRGMPRLDEAAFVEWCGIDAYLCVRNIRLAASIMICYCFTGCLMLLPTYRVQRLSSACTKICSKNPLTKVRDELVGLNCMCSEVDRFSIASLPAKSNLLWVPAIGMVILTLIVLFLLYLEYRNMVKIRSSFWLSMPPEMFTILVDDIPSHLRINTQKLLTAHFQKCFPGKVLRVDPVRFTDEKLLDKLRSLGHQRMAVFDSYNRIKAMRNKMGDKKYGCYSLCSGLSSRESLDYQAERKRRRLKLLNSQFMKLLDDLRSLERAEELGEISREIVSCFVTFSSARAASLATQCVIHHNYDIITRLAPEPDDVRWDDLGRPYNRRAMRSCVANAAFFSLLIFWGTFSSLIGAITSADALEHQFDFLHDFFCNYPWVRQVLNQAAPLVFSLLLAVVNPLICYLARMHSRTSEGDADHLATVWYYSFLVIQVFLFYGISGSLLKTIKPILDKPKSIVDLLAASIPKNGRFYIQFFATKFVTSLCLDLFRVSDLIVGCFRRLICGNAITPRDRVTARYGCYVATVPVHRNLSSLNGQMLLLFFVAICYAVIQPLLIPIAAIFFILAYASYVKLFISASLQRFDTGGTMWPQTFWCYVSALLTAQLTLIGVLALKKGVSQSSIVVLLFVLTWFVATVIDLHYRRLLVELPIDVACVVDDNIDKDKSLVLVPASKWRYGQLSLGNPNYLCRPFAKSIVMDCVSSVEIDEDEASDSCLRLSSILHRSYSYRLPVLEEPRSLNATDEDESALLVSTGVGEEQDLTDMTESNQVAFY